MNLQAYFKKHKPILTKHIVLYLRNKKKQNKNTTFFYIDCIDRLIEFVPKGKLIRGLLTILSYQMFSKKRGTKIYNLATSIELMHSALLIHDDIMDDDYQRRGCKTIFAQYIEYGEKNNCKDEVSFGNSLGICTGDMALFMANEIFTTVITNHPNRKNLSQFFSQELQDVVSGQMLDVYWGKTNKEPKPEQILNLYRLKTARYSFTLPLIIGALYAGVNTTELKILEKLGETLGVIFQLRDDEIGLLGDKEKTGKVTGSDIRENKKTYIRALLYKNVSSKKKELDTYFGNKNLSSKQLISLQNILKESGVLNEIQVKITELQNECLSLISLVKISSTYKRLLEQFVLLLLHRNS